MRPSAATLQYHCWLDKEGRDVGHILRTFLSAESLPDYIGPAVQVLPRVDHLSCPAIVIAQIHDITSAPHLCSSVHDITTNAIR